MEMEKKYPWFTTSWQLFVWAGKYNRLVQRYIEQDRRFDEMHRKLLEADMRNVELREKLGRVVDQQIREGDFFPPLPRVRTEMHRQAETLRQHVRAISPKPPPASVRPIAPSPAPVPTAPDSTLGPVLAVGAAALLASEAAQASPEPAPAPTVSSGGGGDFENAGSSGGWSSPSSSPASNSDSSYGGGSDSGSSSSSGDSGGGGGGGGGD